MIYGIMIFAAIGCFAWLVDDGNAGFFITLISAVVLLILSVAHIGVWVDSKGESEQFIAVAESVTRARVSGVSELELAALQHKIIEWNSWLARKQYWSSTIWGPFYPDVIDDLTPIQ